MASETTDYAAEAASTFPPFHQTETFASQIFWLVVTFFVLYLILSRVILPRIGGTLERRSNKIADDLDMAAKLNDDASDAKTNLEKSLAEARASARKTAEDARQASDAEISAETAKAEAELETKLEEAEARISAVRTEAMSNVKGVAAEAAGAMIKQLGGKANKANLDKALDAAIARQ